MCKQKKKAVTQARDTAFFFQQFLADSNIFFHSTWFFAVFTLFSNDKKKLEESCMITEKKL